MCEINCALKRVFRHYVIVSKNKIYAVILRERRHILLQRESNHGGLDGDVTE